MSSELRLKKLRGSGGYIMAQVSDQQQMKGNLGGPDLFLAPIGRIDTDRISKHFCNTCEQEFEGPPRIDYDSPNEEVAENLVLAERGQYMCGSCNSTLAEYREFTKPDQDNDVGLAKPAQPDATMDAPAQPPMPPVHEDMAQDTITPDIVPQDIAQDPMPQDTTQGTAQDTATIPSPAAAVTPIQGMTVFDEDAKKLGTARQVGVDPNRTLVLIITQDDGTDVSVPWSRVRRVGEVIFLGDPEAPSTTETGKCPKCGFVNKADSKFCEECGNGLV